MGSEEGGEVAGGEDPAELGQDKATPKRGGHRRPGRELRLECTHLTKKYPRGGHCVRQTRFQPPVLWVDNVFDVAWAEGVHPHAHPHHDPADHDHGEVGSIGKKKIGGEENEGK